MVFPEHVLVGWLVTIRYQQDIEANEDLRIPASIVEALIAKGWLKKVEDPEPWVDRDCDCSSITEAGRAACDLAAPEWGLDLETIC